MTKRLAPDPTGDPPAIPGEMFTGPRAEFRSMFAVSNDDAAIQLARVGHRVFARMGAAAHAKLMAECVPVAKSDNGIASLGVPWGLGGIDVYLDTRLAPDDVEYRHDMWSCPRCVGPSWVDRVRWSK